MNHILHAMTLIIAGRRFARFPVGKGSLAQVLVANHFRAAEILGYRRGSLVVGQHGTG
ncbi:hypothetical protein SAMN02745157_1499 [Kaistia soli DSM 19436]|uniref:Uncharacterized protein n=1 Tax=Kaistia soli DSM 19436 TaxID=1122133 RepID=A0A1M4YEG7_9HYPH|nr:hypothetical protein [Kaistia soli]SHF04135.1 hypothetical protein SAMN02745157_1499 [Kaistia soli DSM 19436]